MASHRSKGKGSTRRRFVKSPKKPQNVPLDNAVSKLPVQRPYMDDLPEDILLAIFTAVISDEPFGPQYCLAAVCKRWRDIVMQAPLLWSLVVIQGPKILEALRLFEKSAPALVNLYMNASWHQLGRNLKYTYKVVTQNAPQLRSMVIQAWAPKELVPFFEGWSNIDTPHLKHISITASKPESPIIFSSHPVNPLSHLPASPAHHPFFPSTAWLSGQTFPPQPPPAQLPAQEIILPAWPGISALTSLRLDGFEMHQFPPAPNLKLLELKKMEPTSEGFEGLFSRFPLLETLIICTLYSTRYDYDTKPPLPIHAPSLRSLAISSPSFHGDNCGCGLSYLVTSSLEYLEVNGFCPLFGGHHAPFISRLKDIKSLRKIRINNASIGRAEVALFADLSTNIDLELIPPRQYGEGILLALLRMRHLRSLTLNMTSSGKSISGHNEMDVGAFCRITRRWRPTLSVPTILRLQDKDDLMIIEQEVIEILGGQLTILTSLGDSVLIKARAPERFIHVKSPAVATFDHFRDHFGEDYNYHVHSHFFGGGHHYQNYEDYEDYEDPATDLFDDLNNLFLEGGEAGLRLNQINFEDSQ